AAGTAGARARRRPRPPRSAPARTSPRPAAAGPARCWPAPGPGPGPPLPPRSPPRYAIPCAGPPRSSLPPSAAPFLLSSGGDPVAGMPNCGSVSGRTSFEPHHGEGRQAGTSLTSQALRPAGGSGASPSALQRYDQNRSASIHEQLGGYARPRGLLSQQVMALAAIG